jgi:hypothetical protein
MKSISFVGLLAILTMPCFAEPDSVTAGPYKVSFDLGVPKDDYRINVSSGAPFNDDPVIKIHTESLNIKHYLYDDPETDLYSIQRDGILSITLYESEHEHMHTQDYIIKAFEHGLSNRRNPSCYNINVIGEKIDGHDGVLASWTQEMYPRTERDCYWAEYYPSSLNVVMQSGQSSSWEEGFMNLVKTIHVETINETL